jgi:hypothetical protein
MGQMSIFGGFRELATADPVALEGKRYESIERPIMYALQYRTTVPIMMVIAVATKSKVDEIIANLLEFA